jgi:Ca2+-transporting ATPase
MPMPLMPIQILWMNLVTDGLSALALGMEPPEPGVMTRPPRPAREGMLSGRNLAHLLAVGAFIAGVTLLVFTQYLGTYSAQEVRKAETMAFCTIVFLQFAHALNSRSRRHSLARLGLLSNKMMAAAVVAGVAVQVAIVQYSVLEAVFSTVPLEPVDWIVAVLAGASLLVCYEAWKLAKRRVLAVD